MSNQSKLVAAARILLGLVFFIFGLNGFLNFVPMPPPEGAGAAFMGGLAATRYFFPMLKAVEVVAGIALLANRLVPLALTVLAPIVVNIVAFHLFLEPSGMPMAGAILVAELGLAWANRAAFKPLFIGRAAAVGAQAPVNSPESAHVPA